MNKITFGKATLVIGGNEFEIGSINGVTARFNGVDICSDRIEWPLNGWSGSFEIAGSVSLDAWLVAATRIRPFQRGRSPRQIGMRKLRRLKYWRLS
ncbi:MULTISPECIES: hypothetical protein [Burkholderia]|uniref:hypothetical protein n=1 Tax=Burkholderia TaxID=32008 RepID=UPI0015815245|nr:MULTISPECIES: hypothetical protein [Burkholderia]